MQLLLAKPGLDRLSSMYPGPPSHKVLRTSPFARCDKVHLHYAMELIRDTNHSNKQLCKATNTMTDLFYHMVTAHQSGPEMMAYVAILTK